MTLRLEQLPDAARTQRAAEGRAAFAPSPFYEKLIALREVRPTDFAVLSPASKLALGHYEAAKRRAALLAEDNQGAPDVRAVL
ncbi:MAG: hypothetical protein M3371_13805 [Acidobacteriota bacterium]|nr:hypothetical protein [Acidobacteriota bacterium]